MHAIHAALSARSDGGSPAVAALLAALEEAGPELTTMDVHIVSFGGVGSTQLSNHLNAYGITTNLLTDKDTLRHCPRPPNYQKQPAMLAAASGGSGSGGEAAAGAAEGTSSAAGSNRQPGTGLDAHPQRPRHVVYLYGDPLLAVASHYRRGQACHQAQKTCGQSTKVSPATFPATLDEYVERGEDLFGLEQHFKNWLTMPVDYPVVMVRYERMFDQEVAGPLLRMLCGHKLSDQQLEAMTAAFVAAKRPRRSQVPAACCGRMYGGLVESMDRLPPLYIRSMMPALEAAQDPRSDSR